MSRLFDRKINEIIIYVTPEMRKKSLEYTYQAMKDQIELKKFYEAAGDLQAGSLNAANGLYKSPRGTNYMPSEGGRTLTLKKRPK